MALGQCIKNHKVSVHYEAATLKIIQSEFVGLDYHYKRCQRACSRLFTPSNRIEERIATRNIEDDMEVQSIYREYYDLLEECFYMHAEFMFQFFYGFQGIGDRPNSMHEDLIFYYTFNINVSEFEKKRVPYENLAKAFKKKNNYEQIYELLGKNIKLYRSLILNDIKL